MKKRFLYGVAILALLSSSLGIAQDFHFTQFNNTPMVLNPAETGVLNRDIRLTTNYRDQWRGIGKAPFSTIGSSLDLCIYPKGSGLNFFGVGLLAARHSQGLWGLSTTSILVSASYTKAFDPSGNHFVSFGFQGGINQKARTDILSDLTWDNQWSSDRNVFDPRIASQEDIFTTQGRRNFNYTTFSIGALYNGQINSDIQLKSGVALQNINKPNTSFAASEVADLPMRFNAYVIGELSSGFDAKIRFVPSFLYSKMGPQQLINIGFGSRFILGLNSKYTEYNKETSLYTGLLFRYGDALAPVVRYEINKLAFGVSYDFTLSSLSNANRSNGGFEVSIAFNSNMEAGKAKNKARRIRFL
jgi:type IX secretion system PorP/SprF family membrane protein